jgi:hypothetical protein
MLQINPKRLPRLDELEADLLTRKARAESEGWIGEIEGLDLTLTFLRDKRDQTRQLPPPGATHLGTPHLQRPSRDCGSRTDHLNRATETSVAL